MENKNSLYWSYNLPLQVWPIREDPNNEESAIVDYRLLNYMPRKERCCDLNLSDTIDEQDHESFFNTAAMYFDNLARQYRELARHKREYIYYHDTDQPELWEYMP